VLVLGIAPIAIADIDSNSIINNGVQYYIQTDKSIYNLGENVDILYRVSNLTNENVTLGTVSGDPLAHYDFRVTQGDSQIWRYPYISPTMVIESFILQPTETREFQTSWNLMNDNGTRGFTDDDFFVDPGIYNVTGVVYLFPSANRVPVSLSIDVIPEPATFFLLVLGGLFLKRTRK
jgi:hypothetical protein